MNDLSAVSRDDNRERLYRRLLIALAVLLALGCAVNAQKSAEKSAGSDFARYYKAACVALRGQDVYADRTELQFKYLPVFAQSFAPLAYVSEWAAGQPPLQGPSESGVRIGAAVWFVVLCACYFASLALATSLARPASAKERFFVVLGATAFSCRFFASNLQLGQVNLLMLFLALFGVWLVARGRETAGGAAVAYAAAIKFMPAVLLAWFLLRRRWRAAGVFVAALLLLVFVVPTLSWGLRGSERLFVRYIDEHHKMVTELSRYQAAGQSLPSLANRLLQKTNAVTKRRGEPMYINLVDNPRLAKTVASVLVLTTFGAALYVLRRSGGDASLDMGMFTLLMLLISPEARRAQYVALLIPAATLIAYTFRAKPRWKPWCFLGVSLFLCILSNSDFMGYNDFRYALDAIGAELFGALLLFIAMCLACRNSITPSETTCCEKSLLK